jgi:hypothetical protein
MSAAYYPQVQEIYIAYYGRPADPAGLQYWAGQLAANRGNLASIINAFGTSAESTALYAGASNSAKVTAIYQQIFNRAPDSAGLTFYTNALTAGTMTAASIALNVADGATGVDATYLANKMTVAQAFSDALTTDSAANLAYTGTTAATAARALITGVTTSAATTNVASTISTIKTGGGGSVAGQTFTLTQGGETVSGGSADDTIRGFLDGGAASFSSLDQIDGGAGTDTLVAYGQPATITVSRVSNVERFVFGSGAAASTVDMSTVAGETYVEDQNSTSSMTFNDISAASVGLGVSAQLAANTSTFNYVSGLFSGSTDALNLTVNGAAGTITVTTDDTANIETLNLTATGAASSLTALTAITGLTKVVVTGNANLTVPTAFAAAVTTMDLSGYSGVSDLDTTAGGNIRYTGGSGNDTIDMAGGLTLLDTLTGGSGTDTLVLGAAVTAANAVGVSGFERLTFDTTGITQDVSAFSTINTFGTDAAIAALSLTNVADGATLRLRHNMSTSITTALASNTAADDITVEVGGSAAVTIASLNMDANYETVTINSLGSARNVITAFGTTLGNLTVTGSQAITLTTTVGISGVVDMSAATGANIVTVTSTGGQTVTFGSGNDTLTASGLVAANTTQIINGGAGDDTLTAGAVVADGAAISIRGDAGSDTINVDAVDGTAGGALTTASVNGGAGVDFITGTGGAGAATHAVTIVVSTATLTEDADEITGFISATDDFDYNGAVLNDTATTITAVSNATFAGGLAADADATVYIVSTALTGAAATDMTALVAESTVAGIIEKYATFEASLLANLGTITGLDSTLGANEFVLLNIDDGTNSVILRVNNSSTAVANTLIASEVELIGVMVAADDLVVGDFI